MGSMHVRWRDGDDYGGRRRILRFIREFGRRKGYPPSYREIAGELGLAVSTVCYRPGSQIRKRVPSPAIDDPSDDPALTPSLA